MSNLQTIVKKIQLIVLSSLVCTFLYSQSFDAPDTVCVNTPVNITNTTEGAASNYWNFCAGDINKTPTGTNLGNIGGLLAMPVFMDYVFVNNNYYGFSINHYPGGLIRWNFGNSLLNTPTATDLGNFGGILPYYAEGIQVVQNEGRWYAIVVGGNAVEGYTPRVLKIDFGTDITNLAPVVTDWGNLGDLAQPLDLQLVLENGEWYGFTVSGDNNTITRFNFSNSFNNIPTAVNLGSIGNLEYPTGMYAIKENNSWKIFITNGGKASRTEGVWSMTRLDFGASLLNVPTGVNFGNPGGFLKHPRDLTILKFCGETIGFAVNGALGSSDIVKIDFHNDLSAVPTFSSMGNVADLSWPSSISKIFRVNADLYAFVPNVDENTVVRLRFAGCNNSSIPNSALQNPPPITYNIPGTYNINLTIDDGLPTQASLCKQVVVLPALEHKPIENIFICNGQSIKIGSTSETGSYQWNNGSTTDSIPINTSGVYWVETNRFGCVNRDSFNVSVSFPAVIATKSNDIDCSNDRSQLSATGAVQYFWTPSGTLNNPAVFNPLATPSTTTQYIVEGTDASGCKGYDTILVKVENVNKSDYLMPGAFTPNNDGLNDCYGIKYWGVIRELEFSIYNRWRMRIFFTKDASQCWDGTYKGTKQEGGVYVYMIRARTNCDSEVFRKGTFVLVR